MNTIFTIAPLDSEQKLEPFPGKETSADLLKLQIIDKYGNTVFEKDYSTRTTTVDVSQLKPDNYLVRLFSGKHIEMHEIVIGV